MPYDLPNMGLDYGTLARITQPQMMPEAPLGAGGMAGQMYYKDKNRQDQAIQGAQGLAMMDAQQKGQANEEYNRGAPGRGAEIDVQNSLSQGKLSQLPTLMDTQSETFKGANAKASAERIQQEENKLLPFVNTYSQAKTPEDKQAALELMKSSGVTKIGNKNIEDIPPERMDALMGMIRNKQINSPPQAQKLQALEQVGKNWQDRETTKGEYSLVRTAMQTEARKQVAELMKQGKEAGQKWEEQYFRKVANHTATETEDEMYLTIQKNKVLVGAAKVGATPAQLDPAKLSGVPLKETPTPNPAAMPKNNKTSVETKNTDGEPLTIKKNGKTMGVKGWNANTKEVLLEDGTVVKID